MPMPKFLIALMAEFFFLIFPAIFTAVPSQKAAYKKDGGSSYDAVVYAVGTCLVLVIMLAFLRGFYRLKLDRKRSVWKIYTCFLLNPFTCKKNTQSNIQENSRFHFVKCRKTNSTMGKYYQRRRIISPTDV